MTQRILIGFILSLFCFSAHAENDTHQSKFGFELRAYRTNNITNVGWLGGLRGSRFLGKSPVYLQLAAHYGSPDGLNPGNNYMYYGTFGTGIEGALGRKSFWEVLLTVGYGAGKFSENLSVNEESFLVAEPSFGIGMGLGLGWKVTAAASYIHMNNAPNFSGMTLGFRFEHKIQTTVRAVDN